MSIRSTDTTYRKIGLDLQDVSEFSLIDVSISNMVDSSYSSIGLLLRGRDTSSFINLHIYADTPMQISPNPNSGSSTYSADAMNFHNTYFIATSTNANVKVMTGSLIQDISFTGANIWALGKYGFYWVDASASLGNGRGLDFYNIRWEQSTNTDGYFIYIDYAGFVRGININRVSLSSNTVADPNGIYIRNALNLSIKDSFLFLTLPAGRVTIDVDDTVHPVVIENIDTNTTGAINTGSLIIGDWKLNETYGSIDRIMLGIYGTKRTPVIITTAPDNAAVTCKKDQIAHNAYFFYVCISDNTWMRGTIATW
jgi:hypothetical protein